jgi:hypothetical protein
LARTFFPNAPPNELGKYKLYLPDEITPLNPRTELTTLSTNVEYVIKSGITNDTYNLTFLIF